MTKKKKPSSVDTVRNLCGAVDAEGFVAHSEDQIGLLPAKPSELFQHGDAVKQMPRLNHHGHDQCLNRRVGSEQHADGDKFQAPAIDG